MERFTALESVAVEENRARFLYLKGKLLNVTGEFSSQVSIHILPPKKAKPKKLPRDL